MKVVCPFTTVYPETRAALPADTEYVDVSGSPRAYAQLFRRLWRERETFIVVEHDIVPAPGQLEQLWACHDAWCSIPYMVEDDEGSWLTIALGCTKFDRSLMERWPQFMEFVAHLSAGGIPGHWAAFDCFIWRVAPRVWGMQEPHVHEGLVAHLGNPHPFMGLVIGAQRVPVQGAFVEEIIGPSGSFPPGTPDEVIHQFNGTLLRERESQVNSWIDRSFHGLVAPDARPTSARPGISAGIFYAGEDLRPGCHELSLAGATARFCAYIAEARRLLIPPESAGAVMATRAIPDSRR